MTSSSRSGYLKGSLHHMDDGKGAVRIEDQYDTDIADLWSALTDPRRLGLWVAEVTGDLQLGGNVYATFTSGWEEPGRITICQPPSRLAVTMSPGTPDESVIEATLTTQQGKTHLTVEVRGISLDQLPAHGAGWQAHIEDLASHLSGGQASDWGTRVRELKSSYLDLDADLT